MTKYKLESHVRTALAGRKSSLREKSRKRTSKMAMYNPTVESATWATPSDAQDVLIWDSLLSNQEIK